MDDTEERKQVDNAQKAFKQFMKLLRMGKIEWLLRNKCVRYLVLCSYKHIERQGVAYDLLVAVLRGGAAGGSARFHIWKNRVKGGAKLKQKILKIERLREETALAVMKQRTEMSWFEIEKLFNALNSGVAPISPYSLYGEDGEYLILGVIPHPGEQPRFMGYDS